MLPNGVAKFWWDIPVTIFALKVGVPPCERIGMYLIGLHRIGMHLIDVCLMGLLFIGMHLIRVHLIGSHRKGMHLIRVSHRLVHHTCLRDIRRRGCTSGRCTSTRFSLPVNMYEVMGNLAYYSPYYNATTELCLPVQAGANGL